MTRSAWTGPLLLIFGRSVLAVLAQALVAAILSLRGKPDAWLAAGAWWTVYGTLADCGCLALLWKFTRAEGSEIRELLGSIRLRYGRDVLLGFGLLVIVLPFFVASGALTTLWLYGSIQADPYPGVLSHRALPMWALIYSRSVWWLIWSPTEEVTYNGYALPRIQALTGRAWVAIALVGFCWAIQHSFLPFIPDWRSFAVRFVGFVPGVVVLCVAYLRIRRLAPLIVAHWCMDFASTFMTM